MNAPRSCPRSSLSARFAATAPQSNTTNGPLARALSSCRTWAMTSLPAPVSPKKATVTSVCANRFSVSNTSSIGADRAASRPKLRMGSGARRRMGAGTWSRGGAQLPRPVPWLALCDESRVMSSLATAPAGIFRLGRSLSAVFATSIFRRLPSRQARSLGEREVAIFYSVGSRPDATSAKHVGRFGAPWCLQAKAMAA